MKCLRKIIKTRNGFLEGQKQQNWLVIWIKYSFKLYTTTHKLDADPEIFHEGGGDQKYP